MAIIAIDFDGTLVQHEYPLIGEEISLAIDCCIKMQEMGHKLILWTCRSGDLLLEAVEYCKQKGLVFDAINSNIDGLGFEPMPKIYADLYIDDRSIFANINYDYWVAVYWYVKNNLK